MSAELSTLNTRAKLHRARGGRTRIVLAKHHAGDRMVPLLQFTDADGDHVIELTALEVNALTESLVILQSATQPTITDWWRQLSGRDVTAAP